MEMNRISFKNPFQIENLPDWYCPTCNAGVLKCDSKNIKTFESASSLSVKGHDAWEPFWMSGIFIGLLKCSNSSCNETVAITGYYKTNEDHEFDSVNDRYDLIVSQLLTPTSFNPPLHFFKINKNIPESINKVIISAFNIYWIDISSCANKIRVVVELIMDNLKVPKTFIQSRKRKGYTLHKRIELFKVNNPEQADLLMAIKWIGNIGSHTSDDITKDDILDAFEILNHVTTNLYDKEADRIKKLTKTINKRKKPIGH
jgi:hypothetical protein